MDAIECLCTRRCVRKYKDQPVEFEKVGVILDAGRNAPTAGNLQDWKFILVVEEENRKKISEVCAQQYWMTDAPVHIVVCSEWKKNECMYGKKGQSFSLQGCAAAAQNILLAAHAQGLGSCWIGAFDERMLRRQLKMPEDVIPVAVITIGYADETPEAPTKFTIENITFLETWDNRFKDIEAITGYYAQRVEKAIKEGKKKVAKFVEKLKQPTEEQS